MTTALVVNVSGVAKQPGVGDSGRAARVALGQAMRRRRELLGKTQRAVAEAVGVKTGIVSEMELGRIQSLPGPPMMERLATVLETTVEALLQDIGYLAYQERTPEQLFTATLDDVRQLPVDEDMRELIAEAVRFAQRRWEDEQGG
jgi:transcriptional regulator with XRE-family HTH domain